MQHSMPRVFVQRSTKLIFSGAMILCATALPACGATKAYSGPSRSSGEVATLLPQGVSFVRVNGKAIPATSSGAEVLAGKNTVEFTVDESNFNSADRNPKVYLIELEAVGNTTYAVTGQRGGSGLCAFPLVPETGQPDSTRPAGCVQSR
ncbi:MAG: hypothetical protein U0136_15340 [Bdellovibrionota bacterium]